MNYKYNIIINQRSVIENNWDLKANHMAVLQVVSEMILNNNGYKLTDSNGNVWHWISYKLICSDLPMFDIKERRCNDLVKDLANYGLLEISPDCKKLGKTYLRIGKNYHKLNSSTKTQEVAENCEGIAENCEPPTQKTANHFAENCEPPTQKTAKEKNNTNNKIDTIKKNTNKKDTNKNNFDAIAFMCGLGFDESLVIDYLKVRKEKKGVNTERAFQSVVNEIEKTGLDKNDVLLKMIVRSWAGFEAQWLENENKSKTGQQPTNLEQMNYNQINDYAKEIGGMNLYMQVMLISEENLPEKIKVIKQYQINQKFNNLNGF